MQKGIQSWKNLIWFIWYFFSIPQLLKTLLVPWHRDTYTPKSDSAVERFLSKVAFALFSRILGALIRFATVLVGIVAFVGSLVLFPLFLVFPIRISYNSLVETGSVGKSWSYPLTPFLDKHSRELRVTKKRYIPESRNDVLQQLERILVRNAERNVLLLGNPGVGRTTVLEQFAKEIYWGRVAEELNFKRVVALDVGDMSFEDLERALDEAASAQNIIAVIEDAHRYPILEYIIPYLEEQSFQVVLTSTPAAYHEQWKNQPDAMRYLSVVELPEPSFEEVKIILQNYIQKRGIALSKVDEEALEELITYSNKLLLHDPQPEKSLEVLDEMISSDHEITKEGVDEILSQKTGVPLGAIQKDESKVLLSLEDTMKSKVIGQEEAISEVTEALKRSRAGISNPDRPIGVFLFLGPTGVGKTYTAQVLAEEYFGSKESMIRFDMSEFQELHTLESFMERAAQTIEDNPFSLVFVDEFEKAHHDLLNVFLQIFDEGRLTTEKGRSVSFDNAIIICTSNAGSDLLHDEPATPKDKLIGALIEKNIFRPELINRFDAVTVFHALTEQQVHQITRLMLKELNERMMQEKGVRFEITDQLVNKVAKEGYDPNFGARPIRRAMQEIVENQLADKILQGKAHKGSNVTINLDTSV